MLHFLKPDVCYTLVSIYIRNIFLGYRYRFLRVHTICPFLDAERCDANLPPLSI